MNDVQVHKLSKAEALRAYMLPAHVADLRRRSHGLWKILTSEKRYWELSDRYQMAAMEAYKAALHRYYVAYWTAVTGATTNRVSPDYRIQFPGQKQWIRATALQYRQALEADWPHNEPAQLEAVA